MAGMGSCFVVQAGLELLESRNPPTSASESSGITGIIHPAWPRIFNEADKRFMSEGGIVVMVDVAGPKHKLGFRVSNCIW
nr:uncharacterized protein ARRDC1-AS1-like isoform X2 [Gorilla gorilla gorilla]